MSGEFGEGYWEERYRSHAAVHSGRPNPQLVTEVGDLAPGRALDAGCGEGADAAWLAVRGWQVTAVDLATTALRRARGHAETLGADVAGRIDWVPADLTGWTAPRKRFDLVSTHYLHPAAARDALFRRLAESVARGGTLLVVGHHPSGPQHASAPEVCFTAEEVAAVLEPGRWDVVVAEARTRSATGHDGREVALRDTVLRARRRG